MDDSGTSPERLAAELTRLQEAALNAAANAIVITDRDGIIVWVNPAFSELTGYTAEEAIGKNPRDLVKSDHQQRAFYQVLWDTILSGQVWQGQLINRRKDGSLYTEEQTITPVRDAEGTISHFIAVKQDVTGRTRLEAALQTSEERMRFALEAAGVGIWEMDHTTGVLRFSESAEALYGLAPGTFGGTIDAFLALLHADDREAAGATVTAAIENGGNFTLRARTIWPDGSVHWLEGAGREYNDTDGRPLRALGISQDVTARRTLEAQYEQAQKMEAIGQLAGGIAHDFNNLLTIILGTCELLLTDPGTLARSRDDITEIQKAGERAAGLTRQLLAFSRKQVIELTAIDLSQVVADMGAMLDRLIGEDVAVVLNVEPGRALITADRGQVEQVVMNLAVNARDAMPAGGSLTIAAAATDADVVLTVTDTGTGIPPAVQARMFEPFFTTKEPGKGTGLGLATVQSIIARMSGHISVASELGRGTSFTIRFPRVEARAASGAARSGGARTHAGSQTVLLVEDLAPLRALTRRLLERQGHTVLLAEDAEHALRLCDQHAPIDLLLTDVVMPGASGPTLARLLIERLPGLKVLYMSGYTDEAIVQHGVLKPGVAFLHKPFTSEALRAKIREVLDGN